MTCNSNFTWFRRIDFVALRLVRGLSASLERFPAPGWLSSGLDDWSASASLAVEPQSDDIGQRLDLGPLLDAERRHER